MGLREPGTLAITVLIAGRGRRDVTRVPTANSEPGSSSSALNMLSTTLWPSPDGLVTSPLDPIGKDLGYGIPDSVLKLVSSSMLGPVMFTSGTLFLLAVTWWLTR